jgi:hypothetical protein
LAASAGATIGAASRLCSVRDIEGVHSAMSAGLSVIHALSAVDLINQHGVALRSARRPSRGLWVFLDLAGMSIALA